MIDDAVNAIRYLKRKQLPLRFTTNTTTRSLASLHEKLVRMRLPIAPEEVFGVIKAAVAYLRRKGKPRCYLLLTDDPRQDFSEFPQTDKDPEYIVIGDVGKRWDYELMNKLFRMVTDGAEVIALHKGKYWETEQGLQVDMGAFVAGLEYVTGKEATVIGKPSQAFFRLALDDIGFPAEKVAMVGDDIVSDIGGAQKAGMKGILVKTGKYREHLVTDSAVQPDLVIESVADLMDLA